MTTISISNSEYEAFHKFLESAVGIVLGENKHYLVSSRLNRVMLDSGMKSLSDLLERANRDMRFRERVVDAMTTNETSWFRDAHPFDTLKEAILPVYSKKSAKTLRVWSAACSTGQEPYSISMCVQEYAMSNPGALRAEVEIVATDISPSSLEDAKSGVYDEMALARGLSPERRARYFWKKGNVVEVRPEIRSRVNFRAFNLSQSYAPLGRFDVIFCRNVLIYFSTEFKRDVLQRMSATLNPGGYLILGGSESMASYCDAFQMVRVANGVIYQLR